MEKRGQIAIFVIIAIIVVAAAIWFLVRPNISAIVSNNIDPTQYMRQCIEPELKKDVPLLLDNGGDFSPSSYTSYNDLKFTYLCYTSENYKPCIVQQPLLVSHFQKELEQKIAPIARGCLQTLKQEYESKGYSVNLGQASVNVTVSPQNIVVETNAKMIVSKEESRSFDKFSVRMQSQSYDLLSTAESIISFESSLGDAETSLYLQYYPNLVIEKLKKGDDTLYTLRNVITQEEFRFATRSLVWPQGYGVLQ